MKIGVAFDEGQIAANLGSCKQVLVVTTEGREPVSKHMAEVRGTSTTDLIKLASMEQIDVLICGSLGLAILTAVSTARTNSPSRSGSRFTSARPRAVRPISGSS